MDKLHDKSKEQMEVGRVTSVIILTQIQCVGVLSVILLKNTQRMLTDIKHI